MAEYIEREALCYQLAKQATIDGQPRAIKRTAKIVEDFPAADVRPVVRGEWEWEMYQYTPHCSICGGAGFPGPANGKRYNYCPNCGADMRAEAE